MEKWVSRKGAGRGMRSRKGYDSQEEFISIYLGSPPCLALFVHLAHLSHNNGCTNEMVQVHLRARLNLRLITIARQPIPWRYHPC
jgi:hypothetical protein